MSTVESNKLKASRFDANKWYSIKKVAEYTNMFDNYIRKLIREDKLVSKLVTVSGTNIPKRMIQGKSIIAYLLSAKSGSKREDGRNKWIVYLSDAEYKAITKAYPTLLIQKPPQNTKSKGTPHTPNTPVDEMDDMDMED